MLLTVACIDVMSNTSPWPNRNFGSFALAHILRQQSASPPRVNVVSFNVKFQCNGVGNGLESSHPAQSRCKPGVSNADTLGSERPSCRLVTFPDHALPPLRAASATPLHPLFAVEAELRSLTTIMELGNV